MNLRTFELSTVASMNIPITDHGVAAINDRLYAMGGFARKSNKSLKIVEW